MGYYSYDGRYGGGRGFLGSIPPAVRNIIIINVFMMIFTALNEQFMIKTFALFYPTSPFFRIWQPITHMFMHGGFWHLFFNMYTLFIFGTVLERTWGTRKFLVFYFVTGLGAALMHTGVQFIQAQAYISQIADNSQQAMALPGPQADAYGGCLGCNLRRPDGVCNALPGFGAHPPVPACVTESQMVRDNLRGDRTGDGCIQHRRRHSAFRPPRRPAFRLAADPVLEKERQAVLVQACPG